MFPEKGVGDAHGLFDERGREKFQGTAQSDVDRDQGDAQPVAGQHHHHVGAAAQVGEELGVAGERDARRLQPFLRDRAGDDRRGVSGENVLRRVPDIPDHRDGAGQGGAAERNLVRVEGGARRDGDPPGPGRLAFPYQREGHARHPNRAAEDRRVAVHHRPASGEELLARVGEDGDLRADPRRIPHRDGELRRHGGRWAGQRRTSIEAVRFSSDRRSEYAFSLRRSVSSSVRPPFTAEKSPGVPPRRSTTRRR